MRASPTRRRLRLSTLCLAWLTSANVVFSQTAPVVSFEKQIVPLLDAYCIDCHGDADADGAFRVDSFKDLVAGGESGRAVEPGKSGESLLMKFLNGTSGRKGKNQFMPPGKREKMKPEEIAIVKAWIDAGAPGPVASAALAAPREVITPKIAPKVAKPASIQAVAFSPKAQLVAVGRYGLVELLNPSTRAVVRTLSGLKGKVNAVAFSPDGAFVLAAGGEAGIAGDVRQWRVSDGSLVRSYPGHSDACYALAVSPDGKTFATGAYNSAIKLWDVQSGRETATLNGHNGAISSLAFRGDGGVLASASADRTIKLWSLPNGQRLDTLSQPTKEQAAVIFSMDGKKLFAAGADNRIRVYSISATAKEGSNELLVSRYAHEGGILNLSLSADGKSLASTATNKAIKVWNAADLTEKIVIEAQPDWAPALTFTDKAQLVIGRLDGSITVYAAADGKPVVAAKPMKPAKCEIARVRPRAVGYGAGKVVTFSGKGLMPAGLTVHTSHGSLKGEVMADSAKGTSVKVRLNVPETLPRGDYDVWLANPAGQTAKLKLYVDDLQPMVTSAKTLAGGTAPVAALPASVWGTLSEVGQHDVYSFQVDAAQELIFDLAAARIGSKAQAPTLEIVDSKGVVLAVNRGLDSGTDPFLAWTAPAAGQYQVRISNTTMDGSVDHIYHLTVGSLPYVTGWYPLSAQVGQETQVTLIGHHLVGEDALKITPNKEGDMSVPVAATMRSRSQPKLRVNSLPNLNESSQDNDTADKSQPLVVPATVNGRLMKPQGSGQDIDCYSIEAKAGEAWVIETLAAVAGSPADTKIEVLDAKGNAVPRMLLQSLRDSYNNFRSVDANNPDIRLQNWEEMELNEYIYFSGDVMRIFRMPRGPDGGTFFYTSGGKRRSYFDTSATGHPLDEPCYVVEPKALSSKLIPNGLPVFTLNYANDDDADRKLGSDSRLTFTAPADGRYIVRVTDTRGWSGERLAYALTVRNLVPDFSVQLSGVNPTVAPGAAVGFAVRADRQDNFEGPIQVEITGVPAGYLVSSPLLIEAGHTLASGSLHASSSAKPDADWSQLKIVATAKIHDKTVSRAVNGFGKVTLGAMPKMILVLEPDQGGKPIMQPVSDLKKPLELVLAPGQTVKAWLRAVRLGNDGLINLDVHNLPHGVIIDDIGLNGVQIREKENERPFFFRAAKWVQDQDRLVHAALSSARAEADSSALQTSVPILLKVRKPVTVSAK